ncbi:glycoside hydrolase family 6 protein, partial [Streptomyces chartreusis]|uniref:glycoside hydrolase family 6 protein n=1 Tax=Streptomyces chartreusis TaxID=1969 RepID=UPI0033E7F8AC
MAVAASVVVAVGAVTGMVSALDDRGGSDEAGPTRVTRSPSLDSLPLLPSASPSVTRSPSATSASPTRTREKATPTPSPTRAERKQSTAVVSSRLYRHPDSQVLEWVRDNPADPRHAVIESRIAAQPAAVWFADFTPDTITARVRAVTSGGSALGRVPVVVPYAIPDRDCGGYSEGGAPGLDAYDAWIDRFAAGLGSGDVIVVLEPDSVAQADCLSERARADRFASLARAGRVMKAAN